MLMMMMSVVIVRNVMEDNINNHFGRYSLRNAAVNNSKEEHQRLKKLDESWKSILDEIVIEYVTNIGYHGKPSYSETTLFGDSCDCATTRTKEVLCVYLAGIHNTKVNFCDCRKDALTLVRHNLFPASPKLPVTAFHFTFLEFFALLQAEGYLTVQAFAAASATAHKYQNVDRIRKSLGNAYYPNLEMQRRITSELATELADPTLIKEDECPACPKDKMFVALDSNMQLQRRKANEKDIVKAERSLFFEPEKLLNKYDNDSFKPNNNDTTECLSDFKAASQAITSKKLDKFHGTGLFGPVCGRHDVLLYFCNIYMSGEKFVYSLSVLDVILQKHGSNITIFYDIACRFSNAIKKAFEDHYNLDNVNMAVSLFHSFSHSITCQSSYHPRFIEGCNIGLSDGEGCELAWSYLGNFVKITRQMCADRLMAILVHAMPHYQKKENSRFRKTGIILDCSFLRK